MNIFDELEAEVLDNLETMEDTVDSPEIANICLNMGSKANAEVIEVVINNLLDAVEDDLNEMSDRKLERTIEQYGQMIAECIVHDVAVKKRLKRELTNKEYDAFAASASKYYDLLDELETGGNRRSRRNRRTSNRDDDCERGKRGNRNRRGNNDRGSRKRSDRDDRNQNRADRNHSNIRDQVEETRSTRTTAHEEDLETISDGVNLEVNEIITKANMDALPKHLRDLPLYYVGLEKLVYTGEQVEVATLGDNFTVDYQKHRTDLYLSPNRKPENVAKTIEMVEKDLLAAAQKTIKAYVEKSAAEKDPGVGKAVVDNVFNKFKGGCVTLEGVYEMDLPVFGYESLVRQMVSENLEKPNLNGGVISVAIRQIVGFIDSEFLDTENVEGIEQLQKFKQLSTVLGITGTFKQLREFLELASIMFAPDSYENIHRLFNQVVCDAITVSAKISVKTKTLLNDFDDIMKFIDSMEKEDPNIGAVILSNLGWALPRFTIEENQVQVIRNYVFLPFSKNEMVFGSPNRYATIDETNKKELFEAVDKIHEINHAEIGYTAFTTLVTSDNGLIYAIPNKGLTKCKGYYLTEEI